MSNLVSALNHAKSAGFASVEETGLQGMITVRGDLASKAMAAAVKAATGAAVPATRKIEKGDTGAVAWMSPDELLVITSYEGVDSAIEAMKASLQGEHSMVVNVSDARAVFKVSGSAEDVMAKLAPVDFSTEAFQPGEFRRSRLAQVAAAMWKNDDGSFELVCFRSTAQYVFDLLSVSAANGGEVRHLS